MKYNKFVSRINCAVVVIACHLLIASSICDYKLYPER